jgi:thymidylate synthase ThyX
MAKDRRIYTLSNLKPEVKAVTFAKCSRSPKSFSEIANELTEEKSAEFHEKWVVGYGHSSIAEHAVLNIAVENISRLAVVVLEANRLASFTEKSSRYQVFDKDNFYFPEKIKNSEYAEEYEKTCTFLMENYLDLFQKLIEFQKKEIPKGPEEDDKKYEQRLKPLVLDNARVILPYAALANVGVTMNARTLEYAITKMLSHPLEEVKGLGHDIKNVAKAETPTLVKYAQPSIYIMETNRVLGEIAKKYDDKVSSDQTNVMLIDYRDDAEEWLVTALLYKHTHKSYLELKEKVMEMSQEEKEKVIEEALKRLGDFDIPLRELEHIYYTFDCLMDEGAYYDFKRHRMCTQTPQNVTISNGYFIPHLVEKAGLKHQYEESIRRAEDLYKKIYEKFNWEAGYLVLMCHKKRVLFTANLRELYHFIKLRYSPMAHFSVREIAKRIYELVKEKHPLLAKYIKFKSK